MTKVTPIESARQPPFERAEYWLEFEPISSVRFSLAYEKLILALSPNLSLIGYKVPHELAWLAEMAYGDDCGLEQQINKVKDDKWRQWFENALLTQSDRNRHLEETTVKLIHPTTKQERTYSISLPTRLNEIIDTIKLDLAEDPIVEGNDE